MLICLDLTKPVSCAMFGRMMQHNGWHRKYTHTNHNHLLVFVPVADADALAENIWKLYTDSAQAQQLVSNSNERLKVFTPDYVVEQFEQYIKRGI